MNLLFLLGVPGWVVDGQKFGLHICTGVNKMGQDDDKSLGKKV